MEVETEALTGHSMLHSVQLMLCEESCIREGLVQCCRKWQNAKRQTLV